MSTRRKEVSPQYPTKTDPRNKKSTLSAEQQTEVREAFELFDPHKTSHITYHELKVILRALGFDIKKS